MTEANLWLVGVAWRLDRLRWVPDGTLADVVQRDGACLDGPAGEPPWADVELNDRELAARLCAGCPVQDECLELEVRTAGAEPVGVWGALSDEDRRELYPHWLQRGERWSRP
ncbi:WhiB family redox-sensing transcriptional regulator [Crossiella equi]|uniref:WhiB family redox-sensing transcriptional regulator n=1 Tax=Crossiella equi TaxID=130796 RepID=A0ABS5AEV7_9PSEU|nr:WhiB family transcriptional regulator [Crossiella equi]MBP2474729.1 WhiB family redox-sensing transcriptional regulator [Crossiella equi]